MLGSVIQQLSELHMTTSNITEMRNKEVASGKCLDISSWNWNKKLLQ